MNVAEQPAFGEPSEPMPVAWRVVADTLGRPYPVPVSMIALMLLVPMYIFIAQGMPGRTLHAPEIALDRLIPLEPAWALAYGALYLYLIVLPVFVVRGPEHIRRTFHAYVTVWIAAYACFLIYPTKAPRPDMVSGHGFAAWGLRFLYGADPPYNCFPSLHVAHSVVSALTCGRVHRRVGMVAAVGAAVVAISTLFTKQHYIADVIAGALLAGGAYAVFLRTCPTSDGSERRAAPLLAASVMGLIAVAFACCWAAYAMSALG